MKNCSIAFVFVGKVNALPGGEEAVVEGEAVVVMVGLLVRRLSLSYCLPPE